ncbi:uncharacterized protein [Lepeophtheirus salmonis]|uniref:uncharacterized protein n=1 Tax=Lepeophtheirus salmonis TaxID=72036 RepID=UPI001AE22153|nr:uncharacterized protein LOC121114336 [Lepeophtheirus salmonis]
MMFGVISKHNSGLLYLSLCGSLAFCLFVGIYKLFKQPHFLTSRRIFTTEEGQAHTMRGCLLSALFLLPCLKHILSPYLLITLGLIYSFIFVPFATGAFPSASLSMHLKNYALRSSFILSNRASNFLCDTYDQLSLFLLRVISYYIISNHFRNMVACEFFSYIYCCIDGRFDFTRLMFQLKLYLLSGISLLIRTNKLDTRIRCYLRKVSLSWNGMKHLLWMILATLVIIDGVEGIFAIFTNDSTFAFVNLVFFLTTEVNFESTSSGEHLLIKKLRNLKLNFLQELEPLWVPAVIKVIPIFMSLLGIIFGLTSGYQHSIKTKIILILPASLFCIYNPLRQVRGKVLIPLQRELETLRHGFPVPTFEQLESYGTECPICMDTMSTAGRILPCKHIFHSFCIMKCMKSSRLCPVCRQNITVPK